MAYNPFLSMGEPAPETGEAEVLNPFMLSDPEPLEFGGDNPFAAGGNPFADFLGGAEPVVGDTAPTELFGAPLPQLTAQVTAASPPQPPRKPLDLPLAPPRPLPAETHHLILSVTGQMEETSSQMLDRLPPTRSPSPLSMRDLHTPSPTLDSTYEDPRGAPEFPRAAPEFPHAAPEVPRAAPEPPRPAPDEVRPARPPPPARPPRPPVPPPPPQSQVAPQTDDINLFDAPVPASFKPSNEAILSLYSAPKKEEERQIDFLSDDIPDIPNASSDVSGASSEATTVVESTEVAATTGALDATPATTEHSPVLQTTSPSQPMQISPQKEVEPAAPMDCSESFPESSQTKLFEDNNQDFNTQLGGGAESNPFENMAVEENTASYSFGNNIFTTNEPAATPGELFSAQEPVAEPAKQEEWETTTTVPVSSWATPVPASEPSWSTPAAAAPSSEPTWSTPAPVSESWGAPVAAAPTPVAEPSWGDPATAAETSWGAPATAAAQSWPAPASEQNASWGAATDAMSHDPFPESQDAFDAFSAKFDSTTQNHLSSGAWGDSGGDVAPEAAGFEAEAFDPFLSMGPPPAPAVTPRLRSQGSKDSVDDSFNVFIRPKEDCTDQWSAGVAPLAPPPRPAALPDSPRANPFDNSAEQPPPFHHPPPDRSRRSSAGSGGDGGGGGTPPTPLFDEDVSMPLEEFPRTVYTGPGWEMQLRQPNKKKITGQRFWKKVWVRVAYQGDTPVVQLLNSATDKEPFQELPLQACYSVSEIGAQQFDQYGKIFTVKLQYVFYKERPGVRPGQVTKAERITNKLSQFAAYAIQGDYQGVKEFGSDLRKLGLPVEHAPQVSQLFKLGSLNYEDVKQFSVCVEEALFKLAAHRDRALTYKMEEVQVTAVDELYVEQDAEGGILKQIARVRVFFLAFLSGMPDVELGVNDLRRQGKEVVGRHDIIPVATEEWIRVEAPQFHACVQPEYFHDTQIIRFKPPDACYIELMRFRIRPPRNRELPLQMKAQWRSHGTRVELRADLLVPGFASRKLGQVPCEDVCIRFPIPECWIYLFRVEKHFRYGSVKSAHRRTGKIKGIERFLGAVDQLQESLIEVTSGQAKYEHQHRAIVWRMPRLPKEGQGAYTTHNLVCRMALTSFDQIPAELAPHAYVEFTMPATQASHTTVRSVSLQNHDNDPPEKYVRYLARHEYIVGIERTSGTEAPAYAIAAAPPAPPAAAAPAPPAPVAPQPPSSDSDSD